MNSAVQVKTPIIHDSLNIHNGHTLVNITTYPNGTHITCSNSEHNGIPPQTVCVNISEMGNIAVMAMKAIKKTIGNFSRYTPSAFSTMAKDMKKMGFTMVDDIRVFDPSEYMKTELQYVENNYIVSVHLQMYGNILSRTISVLYNGLVFYITSSIPTTRSQTRYASHVEVSNIPQVVMTVTEPGTLNTSCNIHISPKQIIDMAGFVLSRISPSDAA